MRLSEIEKKAKVRGIKDTWKFEKKDLIRTIQCSEGFSACFDTGRDNCGQVSCCWRLDCLR
ncbi:MAG: SAP domain-containing protein [Candidatus Omnitrophota bacterium]